MGLIPFVVALVVLGFLLYMVETYIPMSPPIKILLRVVVVAVLVIWILQVFGLTGPSVPRIDRR
jgi:hypothetical protein